MGSIARKAEGFGGSRPQGRTLRKKDTGEKGNRGEFGSVSRPEAPVEVTSASREASFAQRYRAKVAASNAAFARYEGLSVEVNSMVFGSMSQIAAKEAPEDAVAIGIAWEGDDAPERLEDGLRGIRWVHADGSVHQLDDAALDTYCDQWSDVDRSMITYNEHPGLIERGDSGLPGQELAVEDVEYVIPIRGREHGMTEPEAWE